MTCCHSRLCFVRIVSSNNRAPTIELEAAVSAAKCGQLNVYEAFALCDLIDVHAEAKATLPTDNKNQARLKDLVEGMVSPSGALVTRATTT